MTAEVSGGLSIVSTKCDPEVDQEILEYYMLHSSKDLCDDDFQFQ